MTENLDYFFELKLIEIQRMIKEGERGILWLIKEKAWESFPNEFNELFSILPRPSEEFTVDISYKDIYEKMREEMGIDDWIWNLFAGWGSREYWHEYARTSIPDVFIHSFSWLGDAWGGSRLLISVGIKEEEFSSLGNISKKIYDKKNYEISSAVAGGKQKTVSLKNKRYKNWYGTEEVPIEILEILQKISLPENALPYETEKDIKVYEQFIRRIRTQEWKLFPLIEEGSIKNSKDVFGWYYDKTIFPDTYYHIVGWEYKFREEKTIIMKWEFLTINIHKEELENLKQ